MTLITRLAVYGGAFILGAHGLVFLIFLFGAKAYPSGRLEWSGESLIGESDAWAVGVGRVLVVASIALYVASAIALLVDRSGSGWAWLCLGAGVVSLAAFAWIWPGLLPTAGTYWRGVVLSAVAMVPAAVVLVRASRGE